MSGGSGQLVPPLVRDMLAGAGGGVVCTLVCSPLDVAKTRLQVQGFMGQHKYQGLRHTLRTIWSEEGMRGLYRGLEPSLLTIPLFWAIYFPIYDTIKDRLALWEQQGSFKSPSSASSPASAHAVNQPHPHRAVHHMISAVGAALVSDCVSNPLWVVRTRMMTDIYHGNTVGKLNTWAALRMVFRSEGLRGMYKGLGASFLGLAHVAIQFPLYEELKSIAGEQRRRRLASIASEIDAGVASVEGAGALGEDTVETGEAAGVSGTTAEHAAPTSLSWASSSPSPTPTSSNVILRAGISVHAVERRSIPSAATTSSSTRSNEASTSVSPSSNSAPIPPSLSSFDLVLASALSKLVASSLTYPHEVIRARLQDCRGAGGFGLLEIMVAIAKTEGIKGFYQGLTVNLARVLPACVSTFLSYELIKSSLS